MSDASDHTPTGGIAGRYALAFFDVAAEANALDTAEKDLAGLRDLINESADLRRLIANPVFTRDQQAAAFNAVLDAARADKLTRNFIGLVTRNRRLFALPAIIREFLSLAAARRGELTARVTSARALSKAQQDSLAASLKAALDRDVKLDLHVDADLIGGLVVQVGSRMVDTSIRTKLNNLKTVMKEAG